MRAHRAALAAALAGALVTGLVESGAQGAGLVAPKDAGAIAQGSVNALVIHTGTDELLVLQTSYELKGKKPVESLAWVIPVSNAPTAEQCGAVDDALFRDLAGVGLAEKPKPPAPTEAVGVFEAKALEGRGPAAVKALTAWLETGGYGAFRDKETRNYAASGIAFLAVKVTDKSGKLPAAGLLHPFAVHMPAPRPLVPLKLLGQAGPLDVRITVLSSKALDPARAVKSGFAVNAKRAATLEAKDFPKGLTDLLATKIAGTIGDELKKGPISLLVLEAKGLNAGAEKSKQIESWFMDPELPFAK